ncbi:MAG TPA: glycosyltransferase family 9 protein [Candidatus Limnocylindria bacterium]|jgi:hypothetical protein|nr:glycosyltransferase family 9 protein [Candidatus Limnocylindria bacterium]HTL66470.1 glycosyltransferase family 9 protein [Lacunisphaera sp.]
MNRIVAKLRLGTWGLRTLVSHPWPRVLTHFAAGVGDELMLTAMIRALRDRGAPRFWVMSNRPELYGQNPDIAAVLPVDPRVIPLARRCGAQIITPRYTVADAAGNSRSPPAHMIACLMATSGNIGPIRLRPVLKLTGQERQAAVQWTDTIVVQPSVRSAIRPNDLKEWWHDRWQHVVDALSPTHRIVQIGGENDPLLRGVLDRRGHGVGLREVAAMLSHARLFLGLESGMMHLARAVDCPGVILFGGRVHPDQAGYAGFTNLVRSPVCSPCWRYTGCELDRQCMRDISPADVLNAVQEALTTPRGPLPEVVAVISPTEQQRIVAALAG